jgi:hypothetical protein
MVFMLVMLLDIVSLCLRMHSASKVMITYLGRNSVVWKTYGSPRRDKDQLKDGWWSAGLMSSLEARSLRCEGSE